MSKLDGKSMEWRNAAHEIIKTLAQQNSFVVSDMVVTALEQSGLGLDNYSPLGGVFTRAAKDGFITKTDQQQQSTRGKSNSAKTVWISMIYDQDDVGPEARALNALLRAALDFNAETVRYASFVYRAGGLDEKNHKKAVEDFKKIQDTYNAKVTKAMAAYQAAGREANNVIL